MQSRIKILTNSNIPKKAWADFVQNHPLGSIFQTPEMFDVYQQTSHNEPIAIAAFEREKIKGVLVATVISNGNLLSKPITARSIIIGGPLVDNAPEVFQFLLKEFHHHLPWYVVYSEIRPVFDFGKDSICLIGCGFKRIGHYNLLMDISVSKEVLWERMHKERRRNVLHAEKVGLQFREVVELKEIGNIIELIEQTYKRKRVPLSYSDIFSHVKSILRDYVHFFAAYYEGRMVAGQVRLCYGPLVYAWFAGSDDLYFKLRPNDFLMWNVICWAHDQAFQVFDFGGGGEPGVPYGVRDYKLKYGCEMYDYGRYQKVHHPIVFQLGKWGVQLLGMKK